MCINLRVSALLILGLFALDACAPKPTPTPVPTATFTATPTPTATVTSTPAPTATPVPPCEPSGVVWVERFPTSRSTEDLTLDFRERVDGFIGALRAANASVRISETYRSRERAYLMAFSYAIARENFSPASVPAEEGVNICWLHRDTEGKPDVAASRRAAEQMVKAYNIAYEPSLDSLHIEGRAIDMTISWQSDLKIANANGKVVTITSEPRNGSNVELHKVAATYGVTKLVRDPPHWYDEGK